MQLLALDGGPLLEGRAVGQAEAGQEIAPVERGRLGQPCHARIAALEGGVRVGTDAGQQATKGDHIQGVVALRQEPHMLAIGAQKGVARRAEQFDHERYQGVALQPLHPTHIRLMIVVVNHMLHIRRPQAARG